MVLNIALVMDWFELWEWWLIVVCRAEIIYTFIHISAREYELVVGSRSWCSWGRSVVEVISFGDEEAVTPIIPSCSDVKLVLVSIRAAVGLT